MKTSQITRTAVYLTAIAIGACAIPSAFASLDLGTYTGSGTSSAGHSISGSVNFVDLGSGQLQITLSNTEPGDTGYIADVMYGVFFNGATITSLVSGDAAKGSSVWTYPGGGANATTPGPLSANTPLDDPWQTASLGSLAGVDAFAGTYKEGLVSTGFTGTQLTDGIANTNHQPYVQSTAVFVVNYSGAITNISDVKFLYGTTLSETYTINAVPETGTVLAGALLLLPLGASMLRILRKNRMA